ncbi:MAG: DMT family transporter [Desulfotalea sp.]
MLKKILDNPACLLILAVAFWSGNFVLGRAVRNDIEPINLAFWRWIVAALIALFLARKQLGRDWPIAKKNLPVMFILSFTGITIFNTLVYVGLQSTVTINALLLQSFIPVCIVFLSFIFFREKITFRQGLGIMISLVGVVTIIGKADLDVIRNIDVNKGDIFIFVAVLNYALYSVFLRKRPDIHPLSFISICFVFGSLMLFPIHLLLSDNFFPPISSASLVSIAYVAIFPSIVSYLCYNRGVELAGASRAGLFIHLMPVLGSFLAVLLLGEKFQLFHVSGILMIGIGLVLANRKGKQCS